MDKVDNMKIAIELWRGASKEFKMSTLAPTRATDAHQFELGILLDIQKRLTEIEYNQKCGIPGELK